MNLIGENSATQGSTNRIGDAASPVLSVDQINSYYGDSHVLHDLSIHVDKSEVVAILGRNGVGKTTLVRSIIGTLIPRSGTIQFNGDDITDSTPHKRSRAGISVVPQGRRILPNLTVKENIDVAITWSEHPAWSHDEIHKLFPRLGSRTGQLGHSLSGGEQQMLAIARALVQDTNLLIMDEPFEGLAPQIIENIYDRLETITERDISMLIVGQNIDETLRLSDRAYIVDSGEIVYEDDAKTLLADTEVQQKLLSVG